MRASSALKLLPACCGFLLTPTSGAYTSVGCAADSSNARVMEVGPIESQEMGVGGGMEATMSAERCHEVCVDLDATHTHFGTEYGKECFCTGNLGTTTVSSACTMECVNNEGEICGGFDAISVYEIDTITPAPTPAPALAPTPVPTPAPAALQPGIGDGFVSIGCAADSQNARVMPVGPVVETTMSAEVCFGICRDLDSSFTHFGTQYGSECFCTDDLATPTESSACTMECANTEGEACGGFEAISVYEIDTITPAPTLAPTPAPALAPTPVPTPAPAALQPGSGDGFVSIGCRADDGNDRIMGDAAASSSDMTAEVCYRVCSEGASFTHFGTQYGEECYCVIDPDLESINKYSDELSAADHCLMACAGDVEEVCGDSYEMSVYEIITELEGEYTSLGCFPDPRDGSKAMEIMMTAPAMSTEICYDLCISVDPDYAFFGTEYGNECWCSMTFSEPTADGVCDYECAGNPLEICGGYDEISAYSIN